MRFHPGVAAVLWINALVAAGLSPLAQNAGLHAPLARRHDDDLSVVLDVVASRPDAARSFLPADFILTDNGRRIAAESLRAGPSDATQLLFVIDAVNSSTQDVSRSEAAVEQFARQGDGALAQPTTVLIVADAERRGSRAVIPGANDTSALPSRELFVHRIPATRNGMALARAVSDYKPGLSRILDTQGSSAASERVRLSLEALSFIAKAEASEPGAKVTIWLSAGWPFLARSAARSSEQLFDSVVYFSDLLRTARILLYAVSPEGITNQDSSAQREAFLLASRPGAIQAMGYAPKVPEELTPGFYKEFLKGVRTAEQANPNDLSLQVLAAQSGGMVAQQENDLKALIGRCAADVPRVVSVAYRPQQVGGTIAYHSVQIRLADGSQALRTRTGFYTR